MSKKQDIELLEIAKIREALGCGHKPMLDGLAEIVRRTRELALIIYKMHQDETRLLAGFKRPKSCECPDCEFMRNNLGAE